MIQNLLKKLTWKSDLSDGNTIVLIDNAFAEILKWKNNECCEWPVFPLEVDPKLIVEAEPKRILALTSSVLESFHKIFVPSVLAVIDASTAAESIEIAVLSSMSLESAKGSSNPLGGSSDYSESNPYQVLCDMLFPAKVDVIYFPAHTVHLLCTAPNNAYSHGRSHERIQLGILASTAGRQTRPLTLHQLHDRSDKSHSFKSIQEIGAADVPEDLKIGLRALAHDLSGSVVFDYRLDPRNHLFAIGHTASFVAHSMLSILEQLLHDRPCNTNSGIQLHSSCCCDQEDTDVESASLLIVDRWEDLFTPLSHGSTTVSDDPSSELPPPLPLGHRILATLKSGQQLREATINILCGAPVEGYQQPEEALSSKHTLDSMCDEPYDSVTCDINLRSTLFSATSSHYTLESPVVASETLALPSMKHDILSTVHKLKCPMSALANLPYQTLPSICYTGNNLNSKAKRSDWESQSNDRNLALESSGLLYSLLAGSEEEGYQALCNALRNKILEEEGKLPPSKKRGVGAEVFALVQSLIRAPGRKLSTLPQELQGASDNSDILNYEDDGYIMVGDTLSQNQLGFSPAVSSRSQTLLSVALAVVESFQRSSGKQFQQHLEQSSSCFKKCWQASFDIRSLREIDSDALAHRLEDIDVSLTQLLNSTHRYASSYLQSADTKSAASPSVTETSSDKSNRSVRKEAVKDGPVDFIHVVLQIIRMIGLFRHRNCSAASNMLEPTGTDRMLVSLDSLQDWICNSLLEYTELCPPIELCYMASLSIILPSTGRDILAYRALDSEFQKFISGESFRMGNFNEDKDMDRETTIATVESHLKQLRSSILSDLSKSIFRPIKELLTHYAFSRDSLANTTAKEDISIFDLLASHNNKDGVKAAPLGLVGRIVRSYLLQRNNRLQSTNIFRNASEVEMAERDCALLGDNDFEYIESPLQQMKRAGLGLLSKGLGSFGFGGSVVEAAAAKPHPSEQPVLVIFVLGGLTLNEVAQAEHQLAALSSQLKLPKAAAKIVLISNRLAIPETVLRSLLHP